MHFAGLFIPKDVIVYCIVPQLVHAFDFMALRSTCKAAQACLASVDESKLKYGVYYEGKKKLDEFVATVRIYHAKSHRPSIANYDSVLKIFMCTVDEMFKISRQIYDATVFETNSHAHVWITLSDMNYDYDNVEWYKVQFLPERNNPKEMLMIRTVPKDTSKGCAMPLSSEKIISVFLPKMKLNWRRTELYK